MFGAESVSKKSRVYKQTLNNTLTDSKEGTLVHTGWVGNPRIGKHLHWVIGPSSDDKIPITKEIIKDYKNDKNRDKDINLLEWLEKPGVTEVPCFYIQEGMSVKSFGHTGLFRVPYDKKVEDFVYICDEHKKDLCDIPTAIFGNEKDFSGRVFFEDAAFDPKKGQTKDNVFGEEKQPRILSTPKPTTFNHYLCQPEAPEPVFKNITERDFTSLLENLSTNEQNVLNSNLRVPYSVFQKQLSGQPQGVIFTEIDFIDEEFRERSAGRGN